VSGAAADWRHARRHLAPVYAPEHKDARDIALFSIINVEWPDLKTRLEQRLYKWILASTSEPRIVRIIDRVDSFGGRLELRVGGGRLRILPLFSHKRGNVVDRDQPLLRVPFQRFARASTKPAGEPLTFGVDSAPPSRERVSELLRSCGLALQEQRTLGRETETEHAWGGFAIAVVA